MENYKLHQLKHDLSNSIVIIENISKHAVNFINKIPDVIRKEMNERELLLLTRSLANLEIEAQKIKKNSELLFGEINHEN